MNEVIINVSPKSDTSNPIFAKDYNISFMNEILTQVEQGTKGPYNETLKVEKYPIFKSRYFAVSHLRDEDRNLKIGDIVIDLDELPKRGRKSKNQKVENQKVDLNINLNDDELEKVIDIEYNIYLLNKEIEAIRDIASNRTEKIKSLSERLGNLNDDDLKKVLEFIGD